MAGAVGRRIARVADARLEVAQPAHPARPPTPLLQAGSAARVTAVLLLQATVSGHACQTVAGPVGESGHWVRLDAKQQRAAALRVGTPRGSSSCS